MGNSFTTTTASGSGTESTLSITRSDIKAALGRFLTISRSSGNWSSDMVTDMNAVIKSGENSFYHPMVLPGEKSVHDWSFLQPIMSLDIDATVADYTLPGDFGGFIDPYLSFAAADNQIFKVELVSAGEILKLRQQENLYSYSQSLWAAETWITGDQTSGQRKKLMLFPAPTSDGTLEAPYHSNPNAISDAAPYPLGGQPHAETLLEAVLSSAELKYNDTEGPHNARFRELMIASVAFDRKVGSPRYLGYNRNRSHRERFSPFLRHFPSTVVFNP